MKRNNKNGRIVVKNVIKLFLVVVLIGTVLGFSNAKSEIVTKDYTVFENDTLWNIANKICQKSEDKDLNIQSVIKTIKDINNLENSNIYEGEVIKIPVY